MNSALPPSTPVGLPTGTIAKVDADLAQGGRGRLGDGYLNLAFRQVDAAGNVGPDGYGIGLWLDNLNVPVRIDVVPPVI